MVKLTIHSIVAVYAITGDLNDEYSIMSMISRHEPVISSLIVIDSLYILLHFRFLRAVGYRWLARWLLYLGRWARKIHNYCQPVSIITLEAD